MTLFERVHSIMVLHFGVAPAAVTAETRFADHLDGDDLDRIEIVMEVEGAFTIGVTDDEMHEFQTVGDLVALVETKIKAPLRCDCCAQLFDGDADPEHLVNDPLTKWVVCCASCRALIDAPRVAVAS